MNTQAAELRASHLGCSGQVRGTSSLVLELEGVAVCYSFAMKHDEEAQDLSEQGHEQGMFFAIIGAQPMLRPVYNVHSNKYLGWVRGLLIASCRWSLVQAGTMESPRVGGAPVVKTRLHSIAVARQASPRVISVTPVRTTRLAGAVAREFSAASLRRHVLTESRSRRAPLVTLPAMAAAKARALHACKQDHISIHAIEISWCPQAWLGAMKHAPQGIKPGVVFRSEPDAESLTLLGSIVPTGVSIHIAMLLLPLQILCSSVRADSQALDC